MPSDCELLHQFTCSRDEAAFAELVRRHADFVYSVALRVTCNGALAQDVTQAVFAPVARQAGKLEHYETLLGWLHTTTRHIAINTVRGEARRRVREHEATAMQNINSVSETNWSEIGPLLDEAVGQLKESDREAVLLRFFKNLNYQEVGVTLGLGEEAARKRVDRALEKLREHFTRRGVTTSSAILTAAISANSVTAAPVGLAANVTTAALAGLGSATVGSTLLLSLFTFYMTTKTKTILVAVVVLIFAALLAIKLHSSAAMPISELTTSTASTAALAPIAASGPKSVVIPVAPSNATTVAKPVVKPVVVLSTTKSASLDTVSSGTLTLSEPPPNADLKTAIPALIHYLETDDYEHIIPFLLTPEEVQQQLQNGQTMVGLADKFRTELKNHGGADFLAQGLNQVKDQPASLDPTGTQAIYELDDPVAGHKNIKFIKKDGLWYGPQ